MHLALAFELITKVSISFPTSSAQLAASSIQSHITLVKIIERRREPMSTINSIHLLVFKAHKLSILPHYKYDDLTPDAVHEPSFPVFYHKYSFRLIKHCVNITKGMVRAEGFEPSRS